MNWSRRSARFWRGWGMGEIILEFLDTLTASHWKEAIAVFGVAVFILGLVLGNFVVTGAGCIMAVGGWVLYRKHDDSE